MSDVDLGPHDLAAGHRVGAPGIGEPVDDEQAAVRLVEGAGHFFEGKLGELRTAVQRLLEEPAMAAALEGGKP